MSIVADYLQYQPGKTAQEEALKVLGLVADADKNEIIRATVRVKK